jgi:hypothetical protein
MSRQTIVGIQLVCGRSKRFICLIFICEKLMTNFFSGTLAKLQK